MRARKSPQSNLYRSLILKNSFIFEIPFHFLGLLYHGNGILSTTFFNFLKKIFFISNFNAGGDPGRADNAKKTDPIVCLLRALVCDPLFQRREGCELNRLAKLISRYAYLPAVEVFVSEGLRTLVGHTCSGFASPLHLTRGWLAHCLDGRFPQKEGEPRFPLLSDVIITQFTEFVKCFFQFF